MSDHNSDIKHRSSTHGTFADSDDDDDQDRMKFTDENDFEDGQWIQGEFYAKSSRRQSVGQSKDDAIYGVFASGDSDGSNGGKRRRGNFHSKSRHENNLSKRPLSFVSQSVRNDGSKYNTIAAESDDSDGSDVIKQRRDSNAMEIDLETDDDSIGSKGSKEQLEAEENTDDDGEEEDVKTSFDTLLHSMSKQGPSKSNFSKSNDDFRKLLVEEDALNQSVSKELPQAPTPALPAVSLVGMGSWEKHTRGIGMKLLQKFGFKGRLGAKEDGISKAIEVTLRPQGVGLGFGDQKEEAAKKLKEAEEQRRQQSKGANKDKLRGIASTEDIAASASWKKRKSARRKDTIKMLNIEDFLDNDNDNASLYGGASKQQVIIDMRGPDKKLTDSSSLNVNAEKAANATPKLGEELLYNIDLVANMLDDQANLLSRQLQQTRKRKLQMLTQLATLRKSSDGEESRSRNLDAILAILDKVEMKLANNVHSVSLTGICQLYKTLFTNFPEEFKIFGLIYAFPSLAMTIINDHFRQWDPLSQADYLLEISSAWSPLSSIFRDAKEDSLADEFSQLLVRMVEQTIVPMIRRTIVNDWDAIHNPQQCLRLCEMLKRLLPRQSFDQMLESLIFPKLVASAENWKPTATNDYPIDTWLQPWIPLLGDRLISLYPDIRRKFSKSFASAWNGQSNFPLTMLKPWFNIFDKTSMDNLIVKAVVPKLASFLRNFSINPQSQSLETLDLVLEWTNFIPRIHFLSLFQGEFFPRWLGVLSDWIAQQPDFEEVSAWYLGWKSIFPAPFGEEADILEPFSIALDMMNLALEGDTNESDNSNNITSTSDSIRQLAQSYQSKHRSYFEIIDKRVKLELSTNRINELRPAGMRHMRGSSASVGKDLKGIFDNPSTAAAGISFKEVVESFAESHSVDFIPKIGKIHDGKQLWTFGSCLCYIDQDVVFVQQAAYIWTPMDLDTLLAFSTNKSSNK